MIPLVCGCGAPLQVPDTLAGAQARCPACQAVLSVPPGSTTPGGSVCLSCRSRIPFGMTSCPRCANALVPSMEDQDRVRREIRRLNAWSLGLGIPGFILQAVASVQLIAFSDPRLGPKPADLAGLMLWGGLGLLGLAMLLVGLTLYARMKGRSWAWALIVLFGVLPCLSLLALLALGLLGKICRFCGMTNKYSVATCARCTCPV